MPISNPTSGAPAGAIAYMAANAVPHGWIKANGAAISRTTYAALFLVIGTTHGAGDGSTTFALPDLRGEFLRSLDDGRGIDTSRAIGSSQQEGVNITGRIDNIMSVNAAVSGVFSYLRNGLNIAGDGTLRESGNYSINGGSNETRPRNKALLACIKY